MECYRKAACGIRDFFVGVMIKTLQNAPWSNLTMPNEKEYVKTIRTALIKKLWFYRKLHGNLYQMGLPDVLLGRPADGEIILIEMKGSRGRKETYTTLELFALLKGPQVGVMMLLWKIKARAGICLGTPLGYFLVFPPYLPNKIIQPVPLAEAIEIISQI